MTPFDALEAYLMQGMFLCGFALWVASSILVQLLVLWLTKAPIVAFICAGAGTPTDRAMRWILWPIKPPSTVS